MLVARAHMQQSQQQSSSQRVGALSLIPSCLGISGHPSGSRQGHPRYTGAVARTQFNTAVQSRNTANIFSFLIFDFLNFSQIFFHSFFDFLFFDFLNFLNFFAIAVVIVVASTCGGTIVIIIIVVVIAVAISVPLSSSSPASS